MSGADSEKSAFECAFIATSYLVERRGEDLLSPLIAPSELAKNLVQALGRPEREVRAAILAREIARITQSLEARRIQ